MHRCLAIPEILAMIFEQVPCGEMPTAVGKRDLAALARTCKLFSPFALDLLWSVQEGLRPLVRCMPSDLWMERDMSTERSRSVLKLIGLNREKELRFYRRPQESDWERVLVYAPKIKTLAMPRWDVEPTSAKYFSEAWNHFFPGRHLLPNIKLLILQSDPELYMPLLVAPSLKSLTTWRMSSHADVEILVDIVDKYPSINALCFICTRNAEERIGGDLSRAICRWRHLVSVNASALDRHALVHVASLPTLRRLVVSDISVDEVKAASKLMPEDSFQALSTLKIVGVDLSQDPVLGLVATYHPPLRHVSLQIDRPLNFTRNEWGDVISAIHQVCSPTSLAELHVTDKILSLEITRVHDYGLDFATLKPLLSFSRLHTLELDPAGGFDLGNDDLASMARAWPMLTKLSLSAAFGAAGWKVPSRITLAGLLPLLQNCPHLETLDIVIDARILPPSETRLDVGHHGSVRSLFLGNSFINTPTRVALLMADLFPNVQGAIMAWWDMYMEYWLEDEMLYRSASDYAGLWAEVSRLMPGFVARRRRERKRLSKINNGGVALRRSTRLASKP
ncbi:hypothetical protein PLICRDRAFT_54566 [Plicaturopsis crispa FD-325 SS-3]|nr:hypothetical protein PLICRDRAFT_54566 [Plicaturopsis crispa FD-325 SS-3]